MYKKYQIFISSTYEDMREARNTVREIILEMNHFPIGMEFFSADNDEQWETIKKSIDTSDYYIVIIGHRYGSITHDNISYTEKEYEYAVSRNIPVLTYVRNRNIAVTDNEREKSPQQQEKLDAFINKATERKICEFWDQSEDLGRKVSIALYKQFDKNNRPGWSRNIYNETEKVLSEMSILSNENRELRSENEILKSKINSTKPIIEVKLNNSNNFKFDYVDNITLLKILEEKYKAYAVGYGYFNLQKPRVVEKKIINGFNDLVNENASNGIGEEFDDLSLRIEKDIIRYLNEKEKYFRIMNSKEYLNILVNNTGNCKATNVDIEIEFPDGVIVLDFDHFYNTNTPYMYLSEDSNKYEIIKDNSFDMKSETNLSLKKLPNTIICNTKKIRIRIKELMHCRNNILTNCFLLVPLRKGEFEIKCSAICEECEKEEVYLTKVFIE